MILGGEETEGKFNDLGVRENGRYRVGKDRTVPETRCPEWFRTRASLKIRDPPK